MAASQSGGRRTGGERVHHVDKSLPNRGLGTKTQKSNCEYREGLTLNDLEYLEYNLIQKVIKEGGALTSGTKIKKMTILRAAHAIFIFHNNIVYSQHLLFVDGSNG
jgi:hypothetical protein